MPSLLYSAENKQIDRVHFMHANFLSMFPQWLLITWVGQDVYIEAAAKCMQYWFRLLKQPATRYSKMAILHDKGHENWITQVKSSLWKSDYGSVWLFGWVGDEKLFLREFKERLRRNLTQYWFSHLSQISRLEMYYCFKTAIGTEEYLDLIKVNIYRTALARFRFWVSPFNAHRLRYSLSEANRACPFCPDEVEDEVHVIFENIRNVYLNKLQDISFQEQVICLLRSTPENSLVALGKYLFFAAQMRRKDQKV